MKLFAAFQLAAVGATTLSATQFETIKGCCNDANYVDYGEASRYSFTCDELKGATQANVEDILADCSVDWTQTWNWINSRHIKDGQCTLNSVEDRRLMEARAAVGANDAIASFTPVLSGKFGASSDETNEAGYCHENDSFPNTVSSSSSAIVWTTEDVDALQGCGEIDGDDAKDFDDNQNYMKFGDAWSTKCSDMDTGPKKTECYRARQQALTCLGATREQLHVACTALPCDGCDRRLTERATAGQRRRRQTDDFDEILNGKFGASSHTASSTCFNSYSDGGESTADVASTLTMRTGPGRAPSLKIEALKDGILRFNQDESKGPRCTELNLCSVSKNSALDKRFSKIESTVSRVWYAVADLTSRLASLEEPEESKAPTKAPTIVPKMGGRN